MCSSDLLLPSGSVHTLTPSVPFPSPLSPSPLLPQQCYRVIFGYMGFAVMNILFLITGLLLIQLLQVGHVHVDSFSLCYMLWNFSVGGWGGGQSGVG